MTSARVLWARHLGVPVRPQSKYGATPLVVEGIRFDSKREARRYQELRVLERLGVVRDLERQPRYALEVLELHHGAAGAIVNCGHYTADFRYLDVESGRVMVEDVKSQATRTTAYRLRKRLVEAIHGVTITEV